MENKEKCESKYDNCPLTYALSIIGGKWRLPIIWALNQNGILRYNALKRNVEGITNMMLTQSLKGLESNGIIKRIQYNEIPPRVEYSLTENGENLIPTLKYLAEWGKEIYRVTRINDDK